MKKKVVQRRALNYRTRTRSGILSYADKISSKGQSLLTLWDSIFLHCVPGWLQNLVLEFTLRGRVGLWVHKGQEEWARKGQWSFGEDE